MSDIGSCPSSAGAPVCAENARQCPACELPVEPSPHGLCMTCGDLVAVELACVLEKLGPLSTVGSCSQVEEARGSLRVLYASTFIGTQPARIASYLRVCPTEARQYAMRFRAAGIWSNGVVVGPWRQKAWLSSAFCRLLLMDALVGAGLAVRGKGGWEFIEDVGPSREAA